MTDEKKKGDGRTVLLKHVRLSFTDSLKEKKRTVDDPNAKPKHSVNLILEKSDPNFAENNAKLVGAIKAAGELKWKNAEAYKAIAEDDPKRVCYRNGSRFKNKDSGEIYAGYEGNMAISCGTPGGGQKRPKLLDRRKRPLRDQASKEQIEKGLFFTEDQLLDVMYGGSYGDVFVSLFGTDKGGRGIFCTVEAIRSHEEGERMGGGVYIDADDFDNLEDDSFEDEPEAAAAGGASDFDVG